MPSSPSTGQSAGTEPYRSGPVVPSPAWALSVQFDDRFTDRTDGRTEEEKNYVCEPAHTLRIGSSTIFPLRLSEARVMTGPERRPLRTFAATFASFGSEGGSDEA